MPNRRRDLTGQKFGRLTAVCPVGSKNGRVVWRFRCDCGSEVDRIGCYVTGGEMKSCGCFKAETLKKQQQPRHGMSNTRLYRIWRGFKKRFTVPTAHAYENYGGRGITVCSEWLGSFEAFMEWALANGYKEMLTLDRIDNDRGYFPDNCRWVTWVVQENNKRKLLDKPGVAEKIRRELEVELHG